MVSPDFAHVMSLHAGEAYAMQNLTKTDRLGLLLSGKVCTFWLVSNLILKDFLYNFLASRRILYMAG